MANVTRYDPFGDLEDLFRGYYVRPLHGENQPPQIKVDVKENDKHYTVHAELPGVKKDDIHVTIEGNQVAISAEVRRQHEEKQGDKLLRSERYFGKVYRGFALAQDVDEAASSARFADGVLELVLPKKAAVAGKKLVIE